MLRLLVVIAVPLPRGDSPSGAVKVRPDQEPFAAIRLPFVLPEEPEWRCPGEQRSQAPFSAQMTLRSVSTRSAGFS